ncbi:MAG: TolC family protein, partial [Saprospiraceae bacterium]|nr:TolC family protein [Saprospiraceae bacterium]
MKKTFLDWFDLTPSLSRRSKAPRPSLPANAADTPARDTESGPPAAGKATRPTRFLATIITLFVASVLPAQSSAVLDEYIRTGLSGNLALQQQNLDLQQQLEAVRQARSLFFPTVQFNATYTRAAGGRKIDFPVGDLLNPVYSTLNQITQTNQFPMLENQQIQFLPDNFQETYFKVAYPLFNSDLRYNRQIRQQLVQSKTAEKAA